MWLLWVRHAPDGSRHARVNEVRSSVTLGVQSRIALVPEATALRVNVPVGRVVVVVVVVVVGVVGVVGVVVGVVVVVVVAVVSSSVMVIVNVESATGS